jgi:integrase
MRGSIINRPKGSNRWSIILEVRDETTGKRKRRWHSFTGTKRQAQDECARLITDLKGGNALEPNKATVGQFLGRWLAHIKTQVSPKSHERYAGIVNQNLIPAIGAVRLNKLKPVQISAAYSAALENGRRNGKGGLAPRTVGHMHRVLKQALGQAVKWKELTHNPAAVVNPPKVGRRPMKTYDAPETVDLIEWARGTSLHIPALIAVMCGLREGEICALRWRHIDWVGAQMSVVESLEQTKECGLRFKSTKNDSGGRPVALSATVVNELRAHRASRAQDLLKLGVRLTDDDLVLGHADGSIMTPMYVSQTWGRRIKKSGLKVIRFHDLRHSHATQMLSNKVHPKVASERLGHSKVGITLDLYSHVIPGMQEDAAALVDAALQSAAAKKRER